MAREAFHFLFCGESGVQRKPKLSPQRTAKTQSVTPAMRMKSDVMTISVPLYPRPIALTRVNWKAAARLFHAQEINGSILPIKFKNLHTSRKRR